MSVQCHACIGGTNVGEDIRKLDYGQHVVSGTPGRVFGRQFAYICLLGVFLYLIIFVNFKILLKYSPYSGFLWRYLNICWMSHTIAKQHPSFTPFSNNFFLFRTNTLELTARNLLMGSFVECTSMDKSVSFLDFLIIFSIQVQNHFPNWQWPCLSLMMFVRNSLCTEWAL